MGLFGNKEEKRAQDDAAKAAADRLVALPVHELATEMMGAFGPDGPGKADTGKGINLFQVAIWLMSPYPRGNQFVQPLLDPIREAFQALENAELIRTQLLNTGGGRMHATRLGLKALEEGNVGSYLKDPATA